MYIIKHKETNIENKLVINGQEREIKGDKLRYGIKRFRLGDTK